MRRRTERPTPLTTSRECEIYANYMEVRKKLQERKLARGYYPTSSRQEVGKGKGGSWSATERMERFFF